MSEENIIPEKVSAPEKIKNGYSSPRWTNEFPDCSMPMTFDTYSNCSFSCLYCFSQYQRAVGGAKKSYLAKEVESVNVNRIKKMFLEPDCSQFGEYIKARKVLQWGGLSDQFDNFERKYGVTLELLRFFKEIDYPICFSTKGTWWLKDSRYTELFKDNKKWNCKFSIITLDENDARIIEGGVDSPQERLDAIGRYVDLNAGGATLRLRPFIIGVSSKNYLELIKQARAKGADAISTEFFCVDTRSSYAIQRFEEISKIAGFDIVKFYQKYSTGSGYLRLNRKAKAPFVLKMKELCDSIGMRFYVSDMDFKDACCNGSCCGLSENWNYSRGQLTQACCIARDKGEVHWSDIADDVETIFKKVPFSYADGLNTKSSEVRSKNIGKMMNDYIHENWNSPEKANSPYNIFRGTLKPKMDEMGEVIYDDNNDIVYVYVDRNGAMASLKKEQSAE